MTISILPLLYPFQKRLTHLQKTNIAMGDRDKKKGRQGRHRWEIWQTGMEDMGDRNGRHGKGMFDVFEPTAYCPGGIWGSYHLGTVHVRADIFGLHLTGSVSPTHLLQVSWGTCLYLTMKRCQQSPKFRQCL